MSRQSRRQDDYVAAAKGAALGARLRRLSATIDADAARVYAARGISFEQRWFGILNQLALVGPLSVRDLARKLGISHASVSETRRSLEAAGLVISRADPDDARRRMLALSSLGMALVAELRPLWDAFDVAALLLDRETGVTEALVRVEEALARKSLYDRIHDAVHAAGQEEGSAAG